MNYFYTAIFMTLCIVIPVILEILNPKNISLGGVYIFLQCINLLLSPPSNLSNKIIETFFEDIIL